MRNRIFLIFLSTCFFLFFTVITVFIFVFFMPSVENAESYAVAQIIVINNIVLIFFALVALIYMLLSQAWQNKKGASVPYVTRLLTAAADGEIKLECDLTDRTSIVIGKNEREESELVYTASGNVLQYEYAVLNLEKNYWYIEAVSVSQKIGIKKEYDDMFRKLKDKEPYHIMKGDVLEIAGKKIIVN